jgi:hypothetical protein
MSAPVWRKGHWNTALRRRRGSRSHRVIRWDQGCMPERKEIPAATNGRWSTGLAGAKLRAPALERMAMRPKQPHQGARRVRVRSAIAAIDVAHQAVAIQPNVYLAEDAGDKVALLPSDGDGAPLVEVPALIFDGWLRRRDVVYLSW